MRQPVLVALISVALISVSLQVATAPARTAETGADTVGICPDVNFTGFSVGPEKGRVPEKMWWDAEAKSYFIQGPELAMRFLYPEVKRPLSEIKSDAAHIYRIPVDKTLTVVDQDVCRPKIEISSECQIAAVPGSTSQPAFVFTAEYYDECDQKPAQVVIRIEKLNVGGRMGIQFSFYNSFRKVYDSGMDIFAGENVVNMGYRLK